ncbi:hypothetical protein AC578_4067 [Pseudocercospora eumusae]|uniref:Uncharacterized protein n=1 Tax=Pseudocercospora eumusae TaxID=321146 RepID=A0A139HDJ5_9PEZI|nr:hypothetical protein AC578_4067 [Pseudocercospora eumusae]
MASYHYGVAHYQSVQQSHNSHSHGHHGRSRRGPRISSQNAHRQYKAQRSPKEEVPAPQTYNDYMRTLEAAKGFDFDDDEVFCPFNLLTEEDLTSIASSGSDRGSLSSGSPEGSPLQQQAQPTPSVLLSSVPHAYQSATYQQSHTKLHQPMAQRTRNAIPIVDPSTRSVASPPMSVSPGRQMQQQYARRQW